MKLNISLIVIGSLFLVAIATLSAINVDHIPSLGGLMLPYILAVTVLASVLFIIWYGW